MTCSISAMTLVISARIFVLKLVEPHVVETKGGINPFFPASPAHARQRALV
jgi:hypothetical protein